MGRKANENYELTTNAKKKRNEPNQMEFKLPKHGCTDIICTIIFLIFLIGLVVISVYAYMYGKPDELILPKDSKGNICGKTKNYENKKYLLFFDITECIGFLTSLSLSCPTRQICVEKCPDETLYDKIPSHLEKIKNNFCFDSKTCPSYVLKSESLLGRCVPFISKDLLNKTIQAINPDTNSSVTIQNSAGDLSGQTLEKAINYIIKILDLEETFQLVYQDIGNSYLFILAVLGIGILISLIWLFILRFIVKPIVYLSIVVVFGLLGFGLYFCIQEYLDLKNTSKEWKVTTDLKYYTELKETWLGLSIIIGILLLIFSLVMLFLRKRIVFAANIIKEVSKAVVSLPASFIWPIFPFVLFLLVLAYCCSIALFLASSGTQLFKIVDTSNQTNTTANENNTTPNSIIPVTRVFIDSLNMNNLEFLAYLNKESSKYSVGDYCIPDEFYKDKKNDTSLENLECYYYSFGYPTKIKGINMAFAEKHISKAIEFLNQYPYIPQAYVAFMLFWLLAFVTGLNQMTLAGSFGIWYWTPFKNEKKTKKKSLPFFTLFKSFGRAFFLHFGTIAFGSLLIAIIKFIRLLLDLIHTQAKSKADSSKLARFLLACCKCCFWCLERFIKFMNRYAYIISAVYGNFFYQKFIFSLHSLFSKIF